MQSDQIPSSWIAAHPDKRFDAQFWIYAGKVADEIGFDRATTDASAIGDLLAEVERRIIWNRAQATDKRAEAARIVQAAREIESATPVASSKAAFDYLGLATAVRNAWADFHAHAGRVVKVKRLEVFDDFKGPVMIEFSRPILCMVTDELEPMDIEDEVDGALHPTWDVYPLETDDGAADLVEGGRAVARIHHPDGTTEDGDIMLGQRLTREDLITLAEGDIASTMGRMIKIKGMVMPDGIDTVFREPRLAMVVGLSDDKSAEEFLIDGPDGLEIQPEWEVKLLAGPDADVVVGHIPGTTLTDQGVQTESSVIATAIIDEADRAFAEQCGIRINDDNTVERIEQPPAPR